MYIVYGYLGETWKIRWYTFDPTGLLISMMSNECVLLVPGTNSYE